MSAMRFPGINTLSPLDFFLLCYAVLMIVLIGQWRMTGARFGMALQAVRQNEGRVAALGLSPYRIRLAAFVISGMVTGLAGALYADLNRFVSPTMMSWHLSGEIMVFIILGGVARLFGPVVGACLFVLFEHVFGSVTDPLAILPRCRAAQRGAVCAGRFHRPGGGEGTS
jgi:branched-chain amino acid transport system permease protein